METEREPTFTLSIPTEHNGPVLLDARPVIRYALYCSNCGRRHEDGDGGPTLWSPEAVADLGAYDWYDGWTPNVDGRALVCGSCYEMTWCSGCDDVIHAWETVYNLEKDSAHLSRECLDAVGVAPEKIAKLAALNPERAR